HSAQVETVGHVLRGTIRPRPRWLAAAVDSRGKWVRTPARSGPGRGLTGGISRRHSRPASISIDDTRGHIMRILFAAALVLLTATACSQAALPRSGPEAQGIRSSAVLAFVEAADKAVDSLHSFILVRHGHVVAEGWWAPYAAESPHMLFSLSKSFTSTAVGIAAAEGKLSVDDPVLKFFPDEAPMEPSANLKAMRLSDLLRMSTGHQSEPPRRSTEPWAKTFLAQPVQFKPGTHFLYNTSATYMLSAAVQKATGQTVLDYLKPRLFDPLGIESPTWEKSPQGVSAGGFGLSVRTEDIAKFGQLYLQKGSWEGKQLVS